MNKWLLAIGFSLGVLSANAQEPVNLSLDKQKVIAYYTATPNGPSAYELDTKAVVDRATAYLQKRVKAATGAQITKMAVVFDLDDTLIWRYPYIKSVDFGYNPIAFDHHQMTAIDPMVPYSHDLYVEALRDQVTVFIITAGCQNVVNAEEKNLIADGFAGWQAIYARTEAQCHAAHASASVFKASQRQAIEQQGYDIVFSIGDQTSDLGAFADKNFKLPNPMYIVP